MDTVLDNILHTHFDYCANTTDEIRQRAIEKGLQLTDEHWNVIDFVNNIYQQSGYTTPNVRQLRRQLKSNFENKGGYRYLYQLFPDDPIDTIIFLTGLNLQDRDYKVGGLLQ